MHSPKCPYIKRRPQEFSRRHRNRFAEPRQRIVYVLLHRIVRPIGVAAVVEALLEQNQHGQCHPVEHLDALVEETVHHTHQMRKRKSAEYPPTPVHEDTLQALARTQSLQVYHGSFLRNSPKEREITTNIYISSFTTNHSSSIIELK